MPIDWIWVVTDLLNIIIHILILEKIGKNEKLTWKKWKKIILHCKEVRKFSILPLSLKRNHKEKSSKENSMKYSNSVKYEILHSLTIKE